MWSPAGKKSGSRISCNCTIYAAADCGLLVTNDAVGLNLCCELRMQSGDPWHRSVVLPALVWVCIVLISKALPCDAIFLGPLCYRPGSYICFHHLLVEVCMRERVVAGGECRRPRRVQALLQVPRSVLFIIIDSSFYSSPQYSLSLPIYHVLYLFFHTMLGAHCFVRLC